MFCWCALLDQNAALPIVATSGFVEIEQADGERVIAQIKFLSVLGTLRASAVARIKFLSVRGYTSSHCVSRRSLRTWRMMAGGSLLSKYHTRQRFPLLRWLPVWMQHRTPRPRRPAYPMRGNASVAAQSHAHGDTRVCRALRGACGRCVQLFILTRAHRRHPPSSKSN